MLQALINALALGSIYLLFALGMSMVWGTIGVLNLAHGAIFMFSAFVGYLIVTDIRLPLIALIAIGMAVGAILSAGLQVFAFQPILKRSKDYRTAEMQMLIAGIGIAAIPLAIAQKVTASNPFGYSENSSFEIVTYDVAGIHITNIQVLIIACGLGLSAVIARWLHRSRSGLALRAIGVNNETASIMGVDRRSLALVTMGIAGALAGLAGVLLTFNLGAIQPESGDALLIKAFAAIVVGGVGSIGGVIAGAYALALAETLVLTYTSGTWVDAVSFGMIFLVLLIRPQGIFGRQEVRRT